ncbi:hypothetical protein [Frankia sp. EI5c]|uniref:hypothetical protein n=1 Tax=Frankia sp. EI5c TaxID=683316 RepID=UPI0008258690|nr:hypothetical protein [Frankia sp. EI5c]
MTFGRRPDDPPTVLWRVHDEMHPAVTVLSGRFENISALKAPYMIENDLRRLLVADHPDVWEKTGEYRQAIRPPATPPCGRLHCTTATRHTHRVYKPGDVVALTRGDPQDSPAAWPFPVWAVVCEHAEDDGDRVGICVDIGMNGHRHVVGPQEIRRLRADEMVIAPSTR